MDDIKLAIGSVFRGLRLARGLSQIQLEVLSGVPQRTISGIERGVSKPGLDIMQRMSNAFGLTPDDILTRAGVLDKQIAERGPIYGDPALSRLMMVAIALSDEDRELLYGIGQLLQERSVK